MMSYMNLEFFTTAPMAKKAMELIMLFDHILAVVLFILVLVTYWSVVVTTTKVAGHLRFKEHKSLEMAWTVLPLFLLVWVALPSLYLLYSHDEARYYFMTVKVIGHQWYWEYEYSCWDVFQGDSFSFDSFMVAASPERSEPRLLVVDKPLVLPYGVPIRVLVTSADVIHSWAVPSLGVKVDGIPGRLNQVIVSSLKPGIAVGMCSEICGDAHAYMPINVEFIHLDDFIRWLWAIKGVK
uniref:cytochrome c oxidase subunit II n=1 Tax=Patelloida saccharinoides TaxID=225156 RepID=UPI0023D8B4B2|nr:cytochrome c oxidase subunit II [Patelloida saccharinoides]WCR50867.1 cytochrome c oxidase subunit 2 [Patelloida saccharinoides]